MSIDLLIGVMVIIAICAACIWSGLRILKDLDWSNGITICISLAVVYYLFVRPIVFHAMQPTFTPGIRQGPLDNAWPCYLLGLWAIFLKWWGYRSRQRFIDREAKKRIDAAKSGQFPDYFLYLRSFEITRKLPVDDPEMPAKLAPYAAGFGDKGLTKVDFEVVLARALEPMAPFVALGRPGEAFGAGRVRVRDDQWKAEAEFLMENASVIFLVPSLTTGTLWEVEHIVARRYLSKTVFILPPGLPGRRWVEICERLSQADFELRLECPDEAKSVSWGPLKWFSIGVCGWLFMLDDVGVTTEAIEISLTPNGMAEAIDRLTKTPRWPGPMERDAGSENSQSSDEHLATGPLVVLKCPHCGVTVATCEGVYPCCRRHVDPAPSNSAHTIKEVFKSIQGQME